MLLADGRTISHETIYIHIWRDKREGGGLYRLLRQAGKLRRKRDNSYDSRGRLAGKRHISDRPDYIEKRCSIGHWKIDTVVGTGAKDCVVTLVERRTGYALVGKLRDRSMYGMSKRVPILMRRYPTRFKTITSDNGTEFHDYASVEARTGVKFYFATPYHSWERDTNENFNGLLRQYIPKGASQAELNQADCDKIAKKLNTRPRKDWDIAHRRNASLETSKWCTSNLKSRGAFDLGGYVLPQIEEWPLATLDSRNPMKDREALFEFRDDSSRFRFRKGAVE